MAIRFDRPDPAVVAAPRADDPHALERRVGEADGGAALAIAVRQASSPVEPGAGAPPATAHAHERVLGAGRR